MPGAAYVCWTTPDPAALNAPSPKAQNRLTGAPDDVSVSVTGCPVAGLADTVYDADGSAVMTIANGSPEALLMTEANARTGWSLVNSNQRFVSVVPRTPGNAPLSSIAFWTREFEPTEIVALESCVPSPFRIVAVTFAGAAPGFTKSTLLR